MKDIQVHLHFGEEDSRYEEIMNITRDTYIIAAKKILNQSTLTYEEKKELLMEMMTLMK